MIISYAIDINRIDLKLLKKHYNELLEEFEETEHDFPFRQFLSEIVSREAYFIKNGVRPEDDPKIEQMIYDVIKDSGDKGANKRQIRDVLTDY